jgi:hypothetical protein
MFNLDATASLLELVTVALSRWAVEQQCPKRNERRVPYQTLPGYSPTLTQQAKPALRFGPGFVQDAACR